MSTLTRLELDRSLAAGRVQPLYLLVGCEGYLRDVAALNITAAALSGTLQLTLEHCEPQLRGQTT